MIDARLDELVLASVESAGEAGATPADVVPKLAPLLGELTPSASLRSAVEASLVRGEAIGRVDRRGRRATVTPAGEQHVQATVGKGAFAGRKRSRVLARALGLAGLDATQLRQVDNVAFQRAEILRRHFGLDLEPLPSLPKALDALAWHLVRRPLSPALADAARRRGTWLRSPKLLLGALVFSEMGHPGLPSGPPEQVLDKAIAVVAAAGLQTGKVPTHVEIRRALVQRWIRGLPAVHPRSPDDDHGQPTEPFAARALAAARDSPTGRVGDHLVFINHAFRVYRQADPAATLPHFKDALLEAHRTEELSLQGPELPQALDRDDLEESLLIYRTSRFCFIRI